MTFKKTLIPFIFISLLTLSSCSPKKDVLPSESEEEKQVIDLILVAGQSNAAGYSPVQSNQTETFENVRYAGMTDRTLIGNNMTTGSDFLSNPNLYVNGVRKGLGYSPNHIGPEYGIAKYLNDDYDEEHPLMVVKTAAGGTTLSDVNSNLSGVYGNWYPRSLWEDGYTPNITSASPSNRATGLLYQLLIENYRTVYESLVEQNYEVNLIGVCFMQGESDADLGGSYISGYGNLLQTFITDLRMDIAEIMDDEWYEDNLPFVIGKIATTYFGYNRPVNINLRTQQDNVARAMENVETVETSDLIIIKSDGTRNQGCEDDWHFNFADMTTLGQRFGATIKSML